jgi:hydrogenase-4 component F
MWVKTAMLFLIVGYGTKMGLAPMHTWLPDAHSEAPSMVSALLSGALLNCAFLGILRGHQVCLDAGLGEFSRDLLVGFGLVSLTIATIFIVGQTDFKRLLAYSSVEHMGILTLAAGLGGAYGMGLHAINHSLTKGGLFLVAGNVLTVYQTKTIANIRGVLRRIPFSGVLWFAGFLAITGSPPFGVFFSEFSILRTALDTHHGWVAAAFLGLLAIIFVGMTRLVLPMLQGRDDVKPVESSHGTTRQPLSWWLLAPPAVLMLLVLMLGLTVPMKLNSLLREIAQALAGKGGS